MKRRSFSAAERIQRYELQAGLCSCGCGRPLGTRYIAEHEIPVALGNEAKPDGLRAWECAAEKTRTDMARICKAKRQAGETGQQKRRREGKTRKIPGRPFQGHRKFDGTPVWKDGNRGK